jgi:hypothetical protein
MARQAYKLGIHSERLLTRYVASIIMDLPTSPPLRVALSTMIRSTIRRIPLQAMGSFHTRSVLC